MQADHFAFEVTDMDRAIKFYTSKLGLELLSRDSSTEEGTEFAFLKLEGGNLELIRRLHNDSKSSFAPKAPPYCPHIAFRTTDMSKSLNLLETRGIPIIDGPYEIKDMVKWVYFSDPDNNVLEFVQWL